LKAGDEMRIVLGFHIGHDRGAALIKDGTVIGAISQERIDRVKYSRSSNIPFETINVLLQYCGIAIKDISCIGLSYDGIEGQNILDLYHEEFLSQYDCDYIPMYLVTHHEAHAYSSFYSSGFSESLILVADGGGDYIGDKQEAETLFVGCNGKINTIEKRFQKVWRRLDDARNHVPPLMSTHIKESEISIGRKYEQITYLLGLGRNGSGKTMGLGSYGKPLMDFNIYRKHDMLNFSLKYKDILEPLYAKSILSNMTLKEYIDNNREDIASSVQHLTEHIVLSLIEDILCLYPCKNLCLAGGVFLNCLLNHKIIENFDLDGFFVMPPAGDDGQAIGAAYYAYKKFFGNKENLCISLPYIGISYTNNEIEDVLHGANLKYFVLNDDELAEKIALRIANNKIVAIHRGRSEIGPRALCHRSILANPTNPEMKDILNSRVKHREPFRPFAPTVIADEQFVYFELKFESEYMLMASIVREEYRSRLPAITHVDNTARVQAVSKQSEPFIYDLLLAVKRHIGFPIVLNTSFNVNKEPIVETPLDAVQTFLKTEIDSLVIGNCIVDKENLTE
jgi:carbamoyltransferase